MSETETKKGSGLGKVIRVVVLLAILAVIGVKLKARQDAQKALDHATILYNAEKYDEAIKEYERALKLRPDFQPAIENLSEACFEQANIAAMSNEYPKAERLLNRAIELGSNEKDIYWKLATALWSQGKKDAAKAALGKHMQQIPNDHRIAHFRRVIEHGLTEEGRKELMLKDDGKIDNTAATPRTD